MAIDSREHHKNHRVCFSTFACTSVSRCAWESGVGDLCFWNTHLFCFLDSLNLDARFCLECQHDWITCSAPHATHPVSWHCVDRSLCALCCFLRHIHRPTYLAWDTKPDALTPISFGGKYPDTNSYCTLLLAPCTGNRCLHRAFCPACRDLPARASG